jgi:hypothetical protein
LKLIPVMAERAFSNDTITDKKKKPQASNKDEDGPAEVSQDDREGTTLCLAT